MNVKEINTLEIRQHISSGIISSRDKRRARCGVHKTSTHEQLLLLLLLLSLLIKHHLIVILLLSSWLLLRRRRRRLLMLLLHEIR
jgi:hypothetical protein